LAIGPTRDVVGLIGAGGPPRTGARTLYSAFRVRTGGEVESEVATPRRARQAQRARDTDHRRGRGLGLLAFGGALAWSTAHDR
jgi:hypothetical protein